MGRVYVYPDMYQAPAMALSSTATATAINSVIASGATTGLCIVNNSPREIRPLTQVLEVYNSSKINSGAGAIGENGVGLKQGCATLSDLSFVLVKNGSNERLELGIVAESLQKAEGC